MVDTLLGLINSLSDPAAMLPDLEVLFTKLAQVIRVAVLAGPVALLVMGLIYLFLAPKEANHSLGFRCWWGMSSVESWQFTQKLAGIAWTALGAVLGVWGLFSTTGYTTVTADDMMLSALNLLKWQLIVVVASMVAINVVLVVLFDRKGQRRSEKR